MTEYCSRTGAKIDPLVINFWKPSSGESRPPTKDHQQHGEKSPNKAVVNKIPSFFPQDQVANKDHQNGQKTPHNAVVHEIPSSSHQAQLGNHVIRDQFRLSGVPGLFGISGVSTRKRPHPAIQVPELQDFRCILCPFAAMVKEELTRHVNAAHGSSTSPLGERERMKPSYPGTGFMAVVIEFTIVKSTILL